MYCCRRLRRWWYRLKRKRYMAMKHFDHFKWCVIGGFAYALGRFLVHYFQNMI